MDPTVGLQGHLAHEKTPTPLGPPYDPRYGPTVGSWEGGVADGRGTPVGSYHEAFSYEHRPDSPCVFLTSRKRGPTAFLRFLNF